MLLFFVTCCFQKCSGGRANIKVKYEPEHMVLNMINLRQNISKDKSYSKQIVRSLHKIDQPTDFKQPKTS